MAPARTSNRRAQRDHNHNTTSSQHNNVQPQQVLVEPPKDDLFLEPMMGTPLAIYVEKDVENREHIVDLIAKNGGTVSPGYSGVPYILVDPYRESGQNLYRQYAGKKGKIVLNARWVIECVNAGMLQTYHTNWAGCKVTGTEEVTPSTPPASSNHAAGSSNDAGPSNRPILPQDLVQQVQQPQIIQPPPPPPPANHGLHPPPITAAATDPLVQHQQGAYSYVYSEPALHSETAGPPQTWQASNGIAPQQTHIAPPPIVPRPPHYRDHTWDGTSQYQYPPQVPPHMVTGVPATYDHAYRQDQPNWVASATEYYQQYEHTYTDPNSYLPPEAGPSQPLEPSAPATTEQPTRGRKRTRTQPQPAPPASSLVVNRRNPPARSPTPPTRVIKSTYGGNLFTADDIEYLKKYIDYCQEQGLVLSLREICERIAIKAPHHTFYSWRRYCNKHQIRLGGYTMDTAEASEQPPPQGEEGGVTMEGQEQQAEPEPPLAPATGVSAGIITAARQAADGDRWRDRSPTPPRALYRSTTGKGVAFTDEDVTFLVRFLEHRGRQSSGRIDMVTFWKDVAAKAPHHSRASWMKFYRRHKHELNHADGDAPLPAPPEKKMRYSKGDDVLLAKFFYNKPDGTSDKVFQEFGRQHPHHPWKGWQEHHRIHKAKIDHLIEKFARGENIDVDEG